MERGVIDCGIEATGGLDAGRLLAEICLADLGDVRIQQASIGDWSGPVVTVQTDHPFWPAWRRSTPAGKSPAKSSSRWGAGRCGRSPAASHCSSSWDYASRPSRVVGVLETSKLPTDEVCRKIAEQCSVTPDHVTLLVARTASIAGTVQVVARSVETALHKLHELGYDLKNVVSGFGCCPAAAGGGGRPGRHRPHQRRDPLWRRSDAVGPR